jgi:hypothetical protein
MKKRGQIFLIGATLFILLIVGMAALMNTVVLDSTSYDFNFVANNIKSEMVRVVEHDIKYSGDSLEDFINKTAVYLERSYPVASFIFIYGNKTSLKVLNYTRGDLYGSTHDAVDSSFSIDLNGESYIMDIYPTTQVYFAITKKEDENVFIGFA